VEVDKAMSDSKKAWMSVEDGLPEHGQWVIARTERRLLGCDDDESGWHICVFDRDDKSFTRADFLMINATEWHVLPSPPGRKDK
jgi:hypothetical protein